MARARQAGATEILFDPWTAHPGVDTVDDWLKCMDQLWRVSRSDK